MHRLLLLIALPSVALAVPQTLAHQGRLLDVDGSGLNGDFDLSFSLYDVATNGSALFTEPMTGVPLSNGYYSVTLGENPSFPIEAEDLDGGARFLGITIDSASELAPRTPISSVAYAIHAQNVVAVDTPHTCDSLNTGALQYDTASGVLEVCDGSGWNAIGGGGGSSIAESCSDLLAAGQSSSGSYTIDPGGLGPLQVYCDMPGANGDGGGWTLVAKTNGSGQAHWTDGDNNLGNLQSPSTSTSGSMGNIRRSAVGRFYRFVCGGHTTYAYLRDPTATASSNWNGSSIMEWNGSYSASPSAYNSANSSDCGDTTCPGPGTRVPTLGRNWMRTTADGCGIAAVDSSYNHSGTLWVK